MEEVLKYITLETYEREKKKLKNEETKIVYNDGKVKIKIMKCGKKVYNIITKYGDMDIRDIAKNLMVQA